jgi:hypothetical protein
MSPIAWARTACDLGRATAMIGGADSRSGGAIEIGPGGWTIVA